MKEAQKFQAFSSPMPLPMFLPPTREGTSSTWQVWETSSIWQVGQDTQNLFHDQAFAQVLPETSPCQSIDIKSTLNALIEISFNGFDQKISLQCVGSNHPTHLRIKCFAAKMLLAVHPGRQHKISGIKCPQIYLKTSSAKDPKQLVNSSSSR